MPVNTTATTPSVQNQNSLLNISNEIFLETGAGPDWRRVQVATFLGDPERQPSDAWKGFPAGDMLKAPHAHLNTYFSVGVQTGTQRSLAGFEKIFVIVLDDVGTKVNLSRAEALFGTKPSYLIETSPGNHQAGWWVEPIASKDWALGLLRSLHLALGQKADNLKNAVTLVRLPVGTNGKARLGPGGWRVRLVQWNPDVRIMLMDWPPIEARIGGVTPITSRHRLVQDMPDPGEIDADPVLRAFSILGRALGGIRRMTMGWGFDVDCPWMNEHSDRIHEGASYVPVKERFHCHHGHCQDRTMGEVRAKLNQLLKVYDGTTLAALEFDKIDPDAVPGPEYSTESDQTPLDQWDDPTPPRWPGGIYTDPIETEIASCAAASRFDHGGLAVAALGAVSAAADKRIKLRPLANAKWTVPPIIWFMLIGDSGSMKTPIYDQAMEPVQKAHNAAMAQWEADKAQYYAQPASIRKLNPPPEMAPVLLNDATVESVQTALSHTPRGLALLRDELAAVLDFDRYAQINNGGQSSRAFYLESYEAKPFTLVRVKRGGLHLKNSGVTIGGGTQPFRVKEYLKITGDGLMQRFIKITLAEDLDDLDDNETTIDTVTGLVPGLAPFAGLPAFDVVIERLFKLRSFDEYTLTPEGEAMIRETQTEGYRLARTTDLGPAFAAEAHKMHGLHARVALVLHLMEHPDQDVIPDDVVERAKRFVNYAVAHSAHVYAAGGARATTQAIGSYLLRRLPRKVTARDLIRNVAVCRDMSTKDLNAAMEPLVNGGWAVPAEPYPTNRVWLVNQRLQEIFPERLAAETARVAHMQRAMNQLGRHR